MTTTSPLDKSSKIFIAGASGMVGSAIIRRLVREGYSNLVGSVHSRILAEQKDTPVNYVKIDLRDPASVKRFFCDEKPDHVFLAAARVGGIHANDIYPAQFIYDNLSIQNNVIHTAYESGVKRLLFLGSSCIYPRECPQPMKEEHLLTGVLEPTNEPYAIAKIAGIKMCESYNRQYGTRFAAVMPTNLYGPNDNFDLETSHVLPALIRKIHEAKTSGAPRVEIWGTGMPRREFLHVDDMAEACVYVMALPEDIFASSLVVYPLPCFVNLGTGRDCTIMELARLVKATVGYGGDLVTDPSKPDGTMVKRLDVSRLARLGWQSKISLDDGIAGTYQWYLKNTPWAESVRDDDDVRGINP